MKIKSKHPYYVRVVNGEILNIITFNKDYKTEFSVFGGIATLYRKKFDFDQNVLNNLKAMNDTAQFYYYGGFAGSPQSFFKRSYSFSPDDSSSVKQAFLEAVSNTKQYIIPVMDNIASLRDCVGHFMIYQSPIMNIIPEEDDQFGDNESLLYFKIDDHSDMTHEFTQYLACHKSFNDYNTLFKHSEEYRKELIQKRDAIYNNNEQYKRIMSEISSRKKANIEKLKKYGLFQENKTETETPKNLTLNAAFKQVFGEALEPFCFKKIKSKYPYYVRMVGNEILHIITVNSRPDNRFEILGGIATVYRQALSLDKKPQDNNSWLLSNFQYYRLQQILNDGREYNLDDLYEFYGGDLLLSEMNRALDITQNIMFKLFDKVDTLEKCIDFYNLFDVDIRIHHSDDFGNKYPVNFYNEGLLLIKTTNFEQYNRLIDKYNEKILKIREYEISNGVWDKEKYNVFVSEQEEYKSKQLGFYKSVLEDKDWLIRAMDELDRRKLNNTALIQQYGLDYIDGQ